MMNRLGAALFLTATLCAMCLAPQPALAQGCDADEAMVVDYVKDLSELVRTTRKESLEQFENQFHQRICLTKLSLSLGLVKELQSCLDKTVQDPATTREHAAIAKAKQKKYGKLESTIEQAEKNLKAAASSKDAKAAMAKFEFPL